MTRRGFHDSYGVSVWFGVNPNAYEKAHLRFRGYSSTEKDPNFPEADFSDLGTHFGLGTVSGV
jgi:hypothetical protein